jgi:peptide/nickel transport system substrate-binding protein
MLLNTVDCTSKGILNPFNNAKIREAMNWAMDRDYVVQEIFGGLAKPKFNPFTTAFPDYARYADLFSAIETKYAFDLEKAQAVVDAEMPGLGATKGADGKWQYKGKPVTVIVLIRTEDLRKEIGNYFSNQLEALGFTVNRQEKVRAEASPIWQGDPNLCTFMAYTAGWISPQIYRDEGLNFIQYNTGELQQLPVMNAYEPSEALQEVNTKLYTNDFATMDERRELFDKGLTLSMEESWWGVWVNDPIMFEAFTNKFEGASDLAGGFAGGQLFPFTARFKGEEGGEAKIASSGMFVQPWNPIGGSNWIDDTIIRNFTVDYGVIYNPFTGLLMPKLVEKADLVAQEGLPIAAPQSDWITLKFEPEIKVPDDAWVDWDATTQKFITAAEKVAADPEWTQTAKTKTTVKYTPDLSKTSWSDGSPFTVADIVFNMIMYFDPGKTESKIYDESLAASIDTFLTHFKGVRIVSTNPLTIETYDDLFALDAENNVRDWYPNLYVTAFPGGMGAWHNMAPAVQAEADGKMAFSETKSTEKEIDYTNQISGPTLDVQMAYVDTDLTEKYVPYAATMGEYVTPEEAEARYTNLKAFYAAHKHIVLGTGPYYIDEVFPVETTVTVARNENYPFRADQFSGFSEPKMMTMSVDGPTAVVAGEEALFDITINFKDKPYAASDMDKVSYTLFNTSGEASASGTAELVTDGQYKVVLSKDVTAKLDSGTAKLTVAAASKAVSLPAFETVEFVVTK